MYLGMTHFAFMGTSPFQNGLRTYFDEAVFPKQDFDVTKF